ncbi:MAG: OmpA family protein [Thiotrichales bacterium]
MNKRSAISTYSIATTVALALSPVSPAFSHGGFVKDSSGNYVKDSSGNCVKNSSFDPKEELPVECGGTPPVKAEPAPPPKPVTPPPPPPAPVAPTVEKVTLDGTVLFGFDQAKLTPAGQAALDQVVERLRGFDRVSSIVVTGHTDSVGSDAYNQKLSERRAKSVSDYLTSKGVNNQLISSQGMGEGSPIADNKTKDGRAKNRRVEVDITGSKTVTK